MTFDFGRRQHLGEKRPKTKSFKTAKSSFTTKGGRKRLIPMILVYKVKDIGFCEDNLLAPCDYLYIWKSRDHEVLKD